MEKYVLTSSSFSGNVVFGYVGGFLAYFHNNASMNQEQIKWILTHLPLSLKNLEEIRSKIKGKLEMIPPDLSFDAFWEAYGKKVNRKRCEPLYKKLTDAEKITCLMSIPAYNSYLKRMGNRAKLDPENYLKKEAFQNPWSQITS
ncbi:glutathione S-transferase family protein [Litoribacter populi]|uniref:hypothetical protein n=1 Tax=Litoribacter populi TaxID=2598460 RepID=UPI00117D659C|nr:hypothetical protein [Litoribacter populi]